MSNSSNFKCCLKVNSITIIWFGNWILPIRNTKKCLVQEFRKHGSENWPRSPLMHRPSPTGSRSRASLLTIQPCAKQVWFKTNIGKRHKYWHVFKFFYEDESNQIFICWIKKLTPYNIHICVGTVFSRPIFCYTCEHTFFF